MSTRASTQFLGVREQRKRASNAKFAQESTYAPGQLELPPVFVDDDGKVFPFTGKRVRVSHSAEPSANSEDMSGTSVYAKVMRLLYVDLYPATVL